MRSGSAMRSSSSEPGDDGDRPREFALAQARTCGAAGGTTWAAVIGAAAADLDRDPPGPLGRLLLGDRADPERSNLPLRLVGAIHRIALTDPTCPLRPWLPSAGGVIDPERAVDAAREMAAGDPERIRAVMDAPVQTNEVGRAAALSAALHVAVGRHPLPVRLFEIGASAGLNLLLDRFRIETDGPGWGPPDSPVRLAGRFVGPAPEVSELIVAERRGCDPDPIDITSDAGRDLLRSFVWPEQVARLALLDAAIAIARPDPPPVDRANAGKWLADERTFPVPGSLTVVMHSAVIPYLGAEERAVVAERIAAAGAAATGDAPFAHLSFEPPGSTTWSATVDVVLESWPGGGRVLLATCGAHGDAIEWWGDRPH
ncbi:MAG: DUF2332 domain-containing protein [Actinomycetota bacterium]